MRSAAIIAIFMALAAGICSAQTVPSAAPAAPAALDPSDSSGATTLPDRQWAFSASLYTYFVPDDHEYLQPTITADRDRLHLEARYNYEAQNTASAWVGYNFAGGEKIAWEITPMLGGVFGDTTGVAPGYKGSITWRKFQLYSEGEYLIDARDSSDSFFYNWSELTYSPVDWFRFGVVAQRTHAYESDRDIQRGLLLGFTWKQLDVAGYLFNPDDGKPILVIGIRLDF